VRQRIVFVHGNQPMFVFPFCDVVWAKIADGAEGTTLCGHGLEFKFECPSINLKLFGDN
jgi:hypothetical protein